MVQPSPTRIPTPGDPALVVTVEAEHGRWWVVFEVTRAAPCDAPPTVHHYRIRSYATERQARIAARWMRAAAERPITARHLNP